MAIILLSVVGKVFCNDWLMKHLDKGQALHEGEADFRVKWVVLIIFIR